MVTRPVADPAIRRHRLLSVLGAWLVVAAAAVGVTAAVDVDLGPYTVAERVGAVGSVHGRAYAERRTPAGPDTPFAGAAVIALPWSDSLARRLQELREGARASAESYRNAAPIMQKARETYERDLLAIGGGSLVRTTVVAPTGRFQLGSLPQGRWMVLAMSDETREVGTPRAAPKERELYRRTPRLVRLRTRQLWLRDVTVAPSQPVELELTDRNVWFTGVVEEREVELSPRVR